MAHDNIKKGDHVALIKSWDNRGVFSYSYWIVGSVGKQQMHLTSERGNFKHRVYANNYADLYRVVEGFDPVASGLERARNYIAEQLAYNQSKLGMLAYHQPSAEERVTWFSSAEPKVIPHPSYVARPQVQQ